MRKTNYFLFALICIFCSNVVFAKNDISIESITSVYDKNSGVLVNEVDGVHNVVFNDSNQSVKFNMNLRNNTNKDISLEDIVLPVASENFFVAKLSGAGNNYKLDANTTEKVTLSLEIVKTEDWGRNFTLSYVGEDSISNNEVTNPNTSVKEIAVILVFATFITGLLVIIVKNKRLSRYVVIAVAFGSIISVIDAKETILLPINLNISFESKNVMQKAYHLDEDENNVFEDYWSYADKIKNVYFKVDDSIVENYEYVFDVSNDDSKSVMAYLVLNSLDTNYYDLYIVSNGVIYFNEDASYYFANMKNIEGIHNLENVDTSNVTNMSRFFYYYGYNSEKVDINFDNIDTSNVTDMSVMFYKTGYNSSDVNLDLSKLDTSKVTNMASMFVGTAYNDVDFNLDVSNFDTSNVTNMYRMFMQTGYGSTQFNLSLGEFEVDSLEKADQLFYHIGYKSTNLSFSILIDNPSISSYSKMFNGVATVSGAEVVVNYTSETEELVDKMIATKSSASNVIKGKLIVDVDNLSIGDEVRIGNEGFNVIDQNDDTIKLFAKYNLSTSYYQTTTENYVIFSNDRGWEYAPGPKEVDIRTWSTEPKNYIEQYVNILGNEMNSTNVVGDLITVLELGKLGCIVDASYFYNSSLTCSGTDNAGWLVNGQTAWTKSADVEYGYMLYSIDSDGSLDTNNNKYTKQGIRPVITISKKEFRNYLKA